ncbi:hypothetical protein ANRL4_00675 [Anaerolineae bacterium]|nr:hypothetical protein ANRL4_00675 [Anaerolineae bacterium]
MGNPVILKELRGRMRGARAFVVLTLYLLLMCGFMLLMYVLAASARDLNGYTTGGQIGRTLFLGIVGIELFLVTFIAPALTAGAISGERERQTYDLVRTTLLPAHSLITGKLIAALSYVMLLLLAAIPLQSIAFLFGGVTEAEVALATVILIVTAILLGAVGVYASAITQRTISANITAYGYTLGVIIGFPLVAFVLVGLFGSRVGLIPLQWQTILLYLLLAMVVTNPLATAYATQTWLLQTGSAGYFTQTLTDPVTGISAQLPVISPWILFTILYLSLAVYFVVKAVRRVRRVEG